MAKAGLYGRISDRVEDTDKTANQIARLTKLAAGEGDTVAGEYIDDDVSAFEGRKYRADWERLLGDIAAGKLDKVYATEPQRFTRGDPVGLDRLIQACKQSGTVLHFANMGVQDPRFPMVVFNLRNMDNVGGLEVSTSMERQANRFAKEIADGKPLWGRRPFGFVLSSGRVAGEHPEEADLIRAAARDIIAGTATYEIARRWNASGVVTPRGGAWAQPRVKETLMRPSVNGWLVYKGEKVSQTLPQILDDTTYGALLTALDRGAKPGRKASEKALLSGIMRCTCGMGMTYYSAKDRYRCNGSAKGGSHVSVRRDIADTRALAQFLQDFLVSDDGEPSDVEEITALREELRTVEADLDRAAAVQLDSKSSDRVQAFARKRERELDVRAKELSDALETALARSAQGDALEAFRRAVHASMELVAGGVPTEGLTGVVEALGGLYAAATDEWTRTPVERKRTLLRGRYGVRCLNTKTVEVVAK